MNQERNSLKEPILFESKPISTNKEQKCEIDREEIIFFSTPPNKTNPQKNISNLFQSTTMETLNFKNTNINTIEENINAEKLNISLLSNENKNQEISHKKITEFYFTSIKKNENTKDEITVNSDYYQSLNENAELCNFQENLNFSAEKNFQKENEISIYDKNTYFDNSNSKLDKINHEDKSKKNGFIIDKKLAKKNLKNKFKENIKRFFFNEDLDTNNILNQEKQISDIKENSEQMNFIESNENNKNNKNLLSNAFLSLKRLRKKADIIKEKNEAKKFTAEMFDNEAELGSDNEEHDDIIKTVDPNDDEENSDLDNDLKDLINDEEDFNENEYNEELKEKFFNDMLKKDCEEIKRVIKGPEEQKKKQMQKELIDPSELPSDTE